MDNVESKIRKHQSIVLDYLKQLAEERNTALGSVADCEVIADTLSHHYQLTRIGWSNRKYHFSVLIHFSIKPDGKIWIQQNNTEVLVGQGLEERGVPKEEIVVGFRPEYLRPATGYAVA